METVFPKAAIVNRLSSAAATLYFAETRRKLDLGFIMGSSGTKADFDFDLQKEVVKAILNLCDISQDAVRVGVIIYGRSAHLRIRLDSTGTSRHSTLTDIDGLRLGSTGNSLLQALQLAKHYLFSTKYGGRRGVEKILIIFTTKPVESDALDLGKELLSRGHKIVTIAIGDEVRDGDSIKLSGRQELALSVKSASEVNGAAQVLNALLQSGMINCFIVSFLCFAKYYACPLVQSTRVYR